MIIFLPFKNVKMTINHFFYAAGHVVYGNSISVGYASGDNTPPDSVLYFKAIKLVSET
jgi:hypothetical protein